VGCGLRPSREPAETKGEKGKEVTTVTEIAVLPAPPRGKGGVVVPINPRSGRREGKKKEGGEKSRPTRAGRKAVLDECKGGKKKKERPLSLDRAARPSPAREGRDKEKEIEKKRGGKGDRFRVGLPFEERADHGRGGEKGEKGGGA